MRKSNSRGAALLTAVVSTFGVICALPVNSSAAALTSAQQQLAAVSDAELNILNEYAREGGFSDIFSLVDAMATENLTTVNVSRIKDLDDSGSISVADAIAFNAFLHGSYLYAYDYTELDVNGDYLIDRNDVDAYLDYFLDHGANSFSAHGTIQLPDYSFEHRSYTKFDYTTMTQSSFVLQESTMLSSIPNSLNGLSLPTQFSFEEEEAEPASINSSVADLPSICDKRSVRIGENNSGDITYIGTGFIVGRHVIATAGHCVYNRNAAVGMKFNPYRSAYAFDYQNNGDGTYSEVPHELTIEFAAVPTAYTTCSNNDVKWWDYGILVVEEDLYEEYGCEAYNLGLVVEGAARSKYNEPGAFETTVMGFHGINPLPRYLTGTLYDYNLYRMTVESDTPYGGASGCQVFVEDGNYDIVIGIIQSNGKHGMIISRPLLEFYYQMINAS